jgi:uncharacterized membrane protein
MENLNLSSPFVIIFGGLILMILLYFWNKQNQKSLQKRKNKTFKERYQERKKAEQEKI